MAVKQQVLAVLERQKGQYVSGEALANGAAVSRAAVWKAIEALRADGYTIDSVKNRGYCLSDDNDILSEASIGQYLGDVDCRLEVRRTVTSTNTLLKALAEQGEPAGKVLVAEQQTEGRGRLHRRFYSPPGSGLYLSLLLRPSLTAEAASLMTTAAAVAVAEAIAEVTGVETRIKWVNDVYANGRKVCGILTEASMDMESGGLSYAVVGIGVNVTDPPDGFPPELAEIAGSLYGTARCSSDVRSRLAAAIIRRFLAFYAQLEQKPFLEAYRRRSLLDGKTVTYTADGETHTAVVRGIDDDLRLLVTTENGDERALSSGEVSIGHRFYESKETEQ